MPDPIKNIMKTIESFSEKADYHKFKKSMEYLTVIIKAQLPHEIYPYLCIQNNMGMTISWLTFNNDPDDADGINIGGDITIKFNSEGVKLVKAFSFKDETILKFNRNDNVTQGIRDFFNDQYLINDIVNNALTFDELNEPYNEDEQWGAD